MLTCRQNNERKSESVSLTAIFSLSRFTSVCLNDCCLPSVAVSYSLLYFAPCNNTLPPLLSLPFPLFAPPLFHTESALILNRRNQRRPMFCIFCCSSCLLLLFALLLPPSSPKMLFRLKSTTETHTHTQHTRTLIHYSRVSNFFSLKPQSAT